MQITITLTPEQHYDLIDIFDTAGELYTSKIENGKFYSFDDIRIMKRQQQLALLLLALLPNPPMSTEIDINKG